MGKTSNIKVTKDGLFEISTGRKIVSSLDIPERIMSATMKVRADTKAMDVDVLLSDGTVFRRKGDSAKTMVELDEIIAFAEAQAVVNQA